jgi:endonuclease/exonuclease/phosphatase family metal-dependent hydrolase
MTTLCACTGSILIASVVQAQIATRPVASSAPDCGRSGTPVRVITYNVQFLPAIVGHWNKRQDPEYRASTLGQKLSVYDIVALNEVFHEAHRDRLLAELHTAWGDAYQAMTSPKPPGLRYNGGLAIATRLPILESHTLTYSRWSTPDKYGVQADGFAAKGVLHARIARAADEKADFIDVFATHMDSKDTEARRVQYQELADFVARYSPADRPALIMGDFNTRAPAPGRPDSESEYDLLLSRLRQARPTVLDLWAALRKRAVGGTTVPDRNHRIDYIFLCNPDKPTCRLRPLSIRVNPFPDPKVEWLSDHAAVEADLCWKP